LDRSATGGKKIIPIIIIGASKYCSLSHINNFALSCTYKLCPAWCPQPKTISIFEHAVRPARCSGNMSFFYTFDWLTELHHV
jgi:hypothetical protein